MFAATEAHVVFTFHVQLNEGRLIGRVERLAALVAGIPCCAIRLVKYRCIVHH